MSSWISEILSMNLVLVNCLLLNDESEIEAFTLDENAEVQASIGFLGPPGGTGAPIERVVELERDRISIQVIPGRTTISKGFPSFPDVENDILRLCDVTDNAIRNSTVEGNTPTAFGFNMQLVADNDSSEIASSYIGNRLFGGWSDGNDWQVEGGTGQLIFRDDRHRRWSFNVQPRPANDMSTKRVYLATNLHLDEDRFPQRDEIKSSYNEMIERISAFLTQLDQE